MRGGQKKLVLIIVEKSDLRYEIKMEYFNITIFSIINHFQKRLIQKKKQLKPNALVL